jgi:hypothetical protein
MKFCLTGKNNSNQLYLLASLLFNNKRNIVNILNNYNNPLKYKNDNVFIKKLFLKRSLKNFRKLLLDYDIYIIWNSFFLENALLLKNSLYDYFEIKRLNKIIVHRFTGFDLRSKEKDLKFNKYSLYRYNPKFNNYLFNEKIKKLRLEYINKISDLTLVPDYELLRFNTKSKILPRIPTKIIDNYIVKKNVKLIAHGSTSKIAKGTIFIENAFKILRKKFPNIKFIIIENKNRQKFNEIIKNVDIYIDQLHIPSLGISSLDALATGIPLITYVDQRMFKLMYKKEPPFFNTNIDDLLETIEYTIRNYNKRLNKSVEGLLMIEKFHCESHILKRFDKIIKIAKFNSKKTKKINKFEISYLDFFKNYYFLRIFKKIFNKIIN